MTFKKFLFFFFCYSLIHYTFALSVKVDETKVYKNGNPGDILEGAITLFNDEKNISVPFTIELEDVFIDAAAQMTKTKPFDSQPDSCGKWINISPKTLTLAPMTSQKVNYIITIPKENLKFPEYFAFIFIATVIDPNSSNMDQKIYVQSKARIGVTVKITISSLAKAEGKIEKFEVLPAKDKEPFKLKYDFKNTGNIFQKVTGSFSVIDDNGNFFGRGNLQPGISKGNDLISIITEWDGELDPGTYDVVAEFKYEPNQVDIKEQQIKIIND